MEEYYPESIEDLTTGGSKASGFIRAIMAKKKAGDNFDPYANKRGAEGEPKKGLDVEPDPKKSKETSRNLIHTGKSKVLKKWVDIEKVENPKKGRRVRIHPPQKKEFIREFTSRQVLQVLNYLAPPGRDFTKEGLMRMKVADIVEAFQDKFPDKVKKILDKKYPMWKIPGRATITRKVSETPESKEKRLAKAREYKAKKGLTKGRKKRGRPRKDEEPQNIRVMEGEGALTGGRRTYSAYQAYRRRKADKIAEAGGQDAYIIQQEKERQNRIKKMKDEKIKQYGSWDAYQQAEYKRQEPWRRQRQREAKKAGEEQFRKDNPLLAGFTDFGNVVADKALDLVPVAGAYGKEGLRALREVDDYNVAKATGDALVDAGMLLVPGGKQLKGVAKTAFNQAKGAVKGALKEGVKQAFSGKGAPPEKLFWKSADKAYDKVAPNNLGAGFEKIMDSPTLDAYLRPSDRSILVASRGTNPRDIGDLSADAQLLMNRLKLTRRYKTDKALLEKLMEQFSPEEYEYYLSGHSLAGAIVQQLKRDYPQLKNAVTYNSAFQTADLKNQPGGVKRIYTDKDFLYNLGGKYFRNAKVIPADPEKAKGFFGAIASALTPSGIKGHSLSNFRKLYGAGILDTLGSLANSAIMFIAPRSLPAKAGRRNRLNVEMLKELKGVKSKWQKDKIRQKYKKKLQDFEMKGLGKKEEKIDFEDDIKWGTLTALHKRYLKKHPSSKFKTLESFAKYITKNPKKFSKKAHKKALFYVNVLNPED